MTEIESESLKRPLAHFVAIKQGLNPFAHNEL